MRKEKSGWPRKVKGGYGGDRKLRGLHPAGLSERLVEKLSDLDNLDSRVHIVRLSRRLGERKRLVLLEKTKQLNLRVANPGRKESRPETEETVGEREEITGKPVESTESTGSLEERD